MTMFLLIVLTFLFLLIADTRREVREIGENMSTLQRDLIEELSHRYGDYRGKK